VQELLSKTGYPNELLHYVKGKVEDTLPTTSPNEISLLRLDTDWYESTKIEMEVLYPKLKSTGIFISDDYGYWEGCRTAIDEYFNVKKLNEKMHKIDKAGYLNLKKSK
jgi:O-methyltransferase